MKEIDTDTVKGRLLTFIKTCGLSQSEFCARIGASRSFVLSISQSIGAGKLLTIQKEFPELNTNWLLTGEGEMLNLNIHEPDDPAWKRIYEVWLQSMLSFGNFAYQIGIMPPILIRCFMGVDISRKPESYFSRILEKWPSINPKWLNTGEGKMMIMDPLFTPDSDQIDAMENGTGIEDVAASYTDEENIDFSFMMFEFICKHPEGHSKDEVNLSKLGVSLKNSLKEKLKILKAENDNLKKQNLYLRKEVKLLSDQLHKI